MITLDEAKALKPGMELYSLANYNRRGDPAVYRVNGQVKTWKRDPSRVKVPLKHGLYNYDYLTEDNLGWYTLDEAYARRARGCFEYREGFPVFDSKTGAIRLVGNRLVKIADPDSV